MLEFDPSYLTLDTGIQFLSKNDATDPRMGDLVSTGFTADSKCVVFGVPQDIGIARNGGRRGAAMGPAQIRTAFSKLTPWYGGGTLPLGFVSDLGDIAMSTTDLNRLQHIQASVVSEALRLEKHIFVIGGGHDIAFGNGLGLARMYPSIGIINIDAHLDVRPLVDGRLPHSGSAFRQLLESEEIRFPGTNLIEFGTQAFSAALSHVQYLQERKTRIYTFDQVRRDGFREALLASIYSLANCDAIYISFDLDSVASAFAPGVSAPASDGFTPDEVIWAAYQAGMHPRVKIVDLAEYNPLFDVDNRSAKLAAMIMASFFAGVSTRLSATFADFRLH